MIAVFVHNITVSFKMSILSVVTCSYLFTLLRFKMYLTFYDQKTLFKKKKTWNFLLCSCISPCWYFLIVVWMYTQSLGMRCLDLINWASEIFFFLFVSAIGGNSMKHMCKLWRASTQTLIVSWSSFKMVWVTWMFV